MEDELRTTNTFEDAKVSEFDDVAESDVANHSASAAVAQVEHLVLRATEACWIGLPCTTKMFRSGVLGDRFAIVDHITHITK